jgi:hypothetical protein
MTRPAPGSGGGPLRVGGDENGRVWILTASAGPSPRRLRRSFLAARRRPLPQLRANFGGGVVSASIRRFDRPPGLESRFLSRRQGSCRARVTGGASFGMTARSVQTGSPLSRAVCGRGAGGEGPAQSATLFAVAVLPLSARNERGGGWGEGHPCGRSEMLVEAPGMSPTPTSPRVFWGGGRVMRARRGRARVPNSPEREPAVLP